MLAFQKLGFLCIIMICHIMIAKDEKCVFKSLDCHHRKQRLHWDCEQVQEVLTCYMVECSEANDKCLITKVALDWRTPFSWHALFVYCIGFLLSTCF